MKVVCSLYLKKNKKIKNRVNFHPIMRKLSFKRYRRKKEQKNSSIQNDKINFSRIENFQLFTTIRIERRTDEERGGSVQFTNSTRTIEALIKEGSLRKTKRNIRQSSTR